MRRLRFREGAGAGAAPPAVTGRAADSRTTAVPAIAGACPTVTGRRGTLMQKMSIRKAGTIRLTTACYYGTCYAA